MTLRYQPPPDWLLQEYFARKNGPQRGMELLEQANQMAGNQIQMSQNRRLLDLKAQESARQQQELGLKQSAETRLQDEYLRKYNPAGLAGAGGAYNQYSPQDFGQAGSPTLTQDAQTRSLLTQEGAAPTLGPSAAQGISPAGFQSPLIASFEKWRGNQGMGMGQNTALAPAPQNPQEQANLEFATEFPLGSEVRGEAYFDSLTGAKKFTLPKGSKVTSADEQHARREGLEQERTTREDERKRNRYRNYFLDLEQRDPVIKEIRKQDLSLSSVDALGELVKEGNTVAFSGLGTKMARGMGEVGVLTEQDIKRYVTSGRLDRKAADTLSKWTKGVPSQATQAEMGQIVKAMRENFSEKIQPRYDQFIETYANIEKTSPEQFAAELSIPYSGKGRRSPPPSAVPQGGGWSYVGRE